jgi:hypothetical protein
MNPIRHYVLKGHEAVPCADVMEWARAFEGANRRVAESGESGEGKTWVSTVFLGLDHQWGDGPPMIFETMVFGGEHDQYQDRCSTWDEAEAMHKRVCAMVGIEP